MPDYKTLRGTSTFTYEEKRSRFIATAAFADTEEKALAVLNAVRAANRTARHNVYAYVLQNGRTRYSDDGEPAKTAGTPVLETIGHVGVSDVIVVAPTRRRPAAHCKMPNLSACGWWWTAACGCPTPSSSRPSALSLRPGPSRRSPCLTMPLPCFGGCLPGRKAPCVPS